MLRRWGVCECCGKGRRRGGEKDFGAGRKEEGTLGETYMKS